MPQGAHGLDGSLKAFGAGVGAGTADIVAPVTVTPARALPY